MNEKKRKVALTMLVSVFVLLMVLTVSYAFIRLDVANIQAEPETINVTTLKKMSLTYKDCNSSSANCSAIEGKLGIGESLEKEFNIANDNDGDIKFPLYFEEVVNSFKNEELVYKLINTDTNEVLVENTSLPNVAVNHKIIDEIVAKKNSNTNYKVVFTFLNKDYSQNANLEASFDAKLGFMEVDTANSLQGKILLNSKDGEPTGTGIYKMEDEYGTSYYYHGEVTNNYLDYNGDMYRIIRINGDGSIRLAYFGEDIPNVEWDANESSFVYGNSSSSNAKIVLEEWFKNHIAHPEDLSDAVFCDSKNMDMTTFKCLDKSGAYTTVDDYNGNASLNYPIGTLSKEETKALGINLNQNYWTMTSNGDNKVVIFEGVRSIIDPSMKLNLIPVINLKADYGKNLAGAGTFGFPYVDSSIPR